MGRRKKHSKTVRRNIKQKQPKLRDRSGILISALLLLIGAGFLVRAFQIHGLNFFIFGVICLLLGLHHYLKEMIAGILTKKD